MDGFETCRRIKAIPALKDIPVIFVTALYDDLSQVTGLTFGAADYITKPVNVIIARHRIHNLIERERQRKEFELEESRQRLRELVAQNEQAREQERKYVAQELHDELGQVLTALRMALLLMELRFCPADADLAKVVSDMKALLDQAIQSTRDVVMNLRPIALNMGLVSAIEWLSHEFSIRTEIPSSVQVDEAAISLDETLSIGIFRIVQESLTNITRYANASAVCISIKRCDNNFVLEISDNGQGFDMAAPSQQKTFGLLGMRERAKALGGRIDMQSAPLEGTKVRVTIPMNLDEKADTP
jgi:signal transduction histidine kinase